jgi:hypothetical protein
VTTANEDDGEGGRGATCMSTEAQELHRFISASVRDMLDA